MNPQTLLAMDWWALGPVIALTAGTLVLLLLEFFPEGPSGVRSAFISLITIGVSAWAVLKVADVRRPLFDGMFAHDGYTVFFTLLLLAVAAVSVLQAADYVKRTRLHPAEYYALLLMATLGMIAMAAANDLIGIFLGL